MCYKKLTVDNACRQLFLMYKNNDSIQCAFCIYMKACDAMFTIARNIPAF